MLINFLSWSNIIRNKSGVMHYYEIRIRSDTPRVPWFGGTGLVSGVPQGRFAKIVFRQKNKKLTFLIIMQ
jgi:hypothetical protein